MSEDEKPTQDLFPDRPECPGAFVSPGEYKRLTELIITEHEARIVELEALVELLRPVLAAARMANNNHPDIRVTNALRNYDENSK